MTKPLWDLGVIVPAAPSAEVPERVESPTPGVGIGTPWGAKPKDHTYWQARGHHTGDDYPAQSGTPVLAVLDGTVHERWDAVLGHVALLYTEVSGQPVTFWYCHLSSYARPNGTKVTAGQRIGRVGMTGTGASRGPHLHLEIRHGHSMSWLGDDYPPRW